MNGTGLSDQRPSITATYAPRNTNLSPNPMIIAPITRSGATRWVRCTASHERQTANSGPIMPKKLSGLIRSPPVALTASHDPIAAPAIHAASLMREGSFPVCRFDQLVETDDHSHRQTRQQEPGSGSPPPVDCVSQAAQHDDRADQRIAGDHCRARLRGVFLQ